MTELLITASFVLVPLFLLVPLLGKYIDIKQDSIQAARYEAWEYTVWYSGSGNFSACLTSDAPCGFYNPGQLPRKSPTDVQKESRKRFFSDPNLLISSTDNSGWDAKTANPLWLDHRGNKLWDGTTAGPPPTPNGDTPVKGWIGTMVNTLMKMFSLAFKAVSFFSGLTGSNVGFNMMDTKGFASSQVVVPIKVPAGVIDMPTLLDQPGVDASVAAMTMNYSSQAGVLSNGWNTGGLVHTTNQVGGLVPTKILDSLVSGIPGLKTIWNILSFMVPEMLTCNPSYKHPFDKPFPANTTNKQPDGSLWMGYMDIDAVSTDRLDLDLNGKRDSNRKEVCSNGYCDFPESLMSSGKYDFQWSKLPHPDKPYSKSPCNT